MSGSGKNDEKLAGKRVGSKCESREKGKKTVVDSGGPKEGH